MRLFILFISLAVFLHFHSSAQDFRIDIDSIEEQCDLPVDSIVADNDSFNIASPYPFIDIKANQIKLNGDNWDDLKKLFNSGENNFNIIHIGDSHIQPDIATGVVRRELQKLGGNAGRGLIIPYKLAGTNEPRDYRMTIDCAVEGSRLMKLPWNSPMDFTGISVKPKSTRYNLKIEQLADDRKPFKFVRFYLNGDVVIEEAKGPLGWIPFTIDKEIDAGYIDVFLGTEVDSLDFTINSVQESAFHGVMLGSECAGIMYHTIGNNGATYANYNQLNDFADKVCTLYPDLVIISLGTNEAYNKMTEEEFRSDIDRMVTNLLEKDPELHILLTTPKECQRRVGNKRKRGTYVKIEECRDLRNVILEYGESHNIPVYDWHAVAGGDGASSEWIKKGLLARDRVHDTVEGYELCGKLFSEALIRELTDY